MSKMRQCTLDAFRDFRTQRLTLTKRTSEGTAEIRTVDTRVRPQKTHTEHKALLVDSAKAKAKTRHTPLVRFSVYADSYALMGWVLNSCTRAARACRGCWAIQSGCAVLGELPEPLVAGLPALLARSGLSGEAAVDADGFAGCSFRVEALAQRTPPFALRGRNVQPFQWESTDRAQIARVLPWSALNKPDAG